MNYYGELEKYPVGNVEPVKFIMISYAIQVVVDVLFSSFCYELYACVQKIGSV